MLKTRLKKFLIICLAVLITAKGVEQFSSNLTTKYVEAVENAIPSYEGQIYTILNNNQPEFTKKQKENVKAFENYSELDELGRCGVAFANICKEIMPTGERKNISSIYPSGWQKGVGYNRCHLIGFQLAGESANKKNLITGTRHFNVSGMLPFENMVDDYVEETDNHVLYRVTPIFEKSNLVAKGVKIEGWSVEDGGEGICFNVFVYNVFNDGKKIDYKTGAVHNNKKDVVIEIKTTKKSYKVSELKTAKKTFSMGITVSSGEFHCKKKSGSSCLSVSDKGKITVKKGTKQGTYKIKVKIISGKSSVTKTVTVKVIKKGTTGSTTQVYISATGSKYHSVDNCGNMNPDKAKRVTEQEALDMGLEKCSKCW